MNGALDAHAVAGKRRARRPAASSSCTSSGSSRATTTSPTPPPRAPRRRRRVEHACPCGSRRRHGAPNARGSRLRPRATGTGPNFTPPPLCAPAPRLRSAAITSARIATAISAGDCAPMARPIGAWMRGKRGLVDAERRAAARAAWHGSSGCRARRHRSSRRASAATSAPSSIFGIVGERGERRERIEPDLRDRVVRPFGEERHVGEALRRGEGRARIDDGHVEAGDLRHRRQRLADVDGADDDEPRRRQVDGEERGSPSPRRPCPTRPERKRAASSSRSGSPA